jgi:predicted NBD/HSP70 family sugar kinase
MYYFVCDIGGTKTRIARATDFEKFDEPVIVETPDDAQSGLDLIIKKILELSEGQKIFAVCAGIAGVLDSEHKTLLKSFHLSNWQNIPIKDILESKLNTIVYLENDTSIVGLGEAVSGAGQGFSNVVYISISTGIGGVNIIDGKYHENKFGYEPGFQILNHMTKENFEDLASGTFVQNKFGMHPKEVAKTENWESIVDVIAIGLHNSILHWSPDVLVVGGSMSNDLKADILTEKMSAIMKIHPILPVIKIAELGSIGGLHGGLAFLKGIS